MAMVVTLLGAGITAALVSGQQLSTQAIGYGGMLTILLASFAAAMVMKGKAGERFYMPLLGSGIYFLCLLCCGALFFDGITGGLMPTLAVVSVGAGVPLLLGSKMGKRQKYKVPKLKY